MSVHDKLPGFARRLFVVGYHNIEVAMGYSDRPTQVEPVDTFEVARP
jgi:hypothetical protein